MTILTVAIGLILTYLILSLIASSLQETIAGWLSLRSKFLGNALDNMLTKKRVWGGPGSVVVRVLAEPFMTVAAVADKQNDRLPGDATVAYDREGRLVWWVGTRSDAARRAKSGEQTP